jgi:hypothetical protein
LVPTPPPADANRPERRFTIAPWSPQSYGVPLADCWNAPGWTGTGAPLMSNATAARAIKPSKPSNAAMWAPSKPSTENLTKVALRQALFVSPTLDPASMLVPIETPNGTLAMGVMREDAVTIGINTRGLAYRPEYRQWMLRVTIEYNTGLISEDQLLLLAEQAGWGVGICEGRPEKASALGWGRFAVEKV